MSTPGLALLTGTNERVVAVPEELRNRVSIGEPASWVKIRHVDPELRAAEDATLLLFDRQHNAGPGDDYYRVAQRVENRQGIHDLGQWQLDFDPATQHVVIHSISVRRGSVAAGYADARSLRFLQRENQLERLVIDGSVTVMVVLNDLRVGDVIDASYTIHTARRILNDHTSLITALPAVSVRSFHFSVRFSKEHDLLWKAGSSSGAPEVTRMEGETEWCWSSKNIKALLPEQRVPPWQHSESWIQVASRLSWAKVSAAVGAVWHDDFSDPGLLQIAGEISSSTAAPAERAAKALEFVQDEIRYLSVNIDLGGQIPSPPGLVLQRRYGDCKDKSFLLSHLLRLLEIRAQPALVNTALRQNVGKWLPSPSLFNHAIVKYEIEGRMYWADPTIQLQGSGALNRLMPDFGSGLPIGGEGSPLEEIPQQTSQETSYVVREKFVLPEKITVNPTLDVEVVTTGWTAEDMRRDLAMAGEKEFLEQDLKFYKYLYPQIIRKGGVKVEDDRASNTFKLVTTYEIPKGVAESGDGLKYIFNCQAHLIQRALALPDCDKRTNSLMFPHPQKYEHNIEIAFPYRAAGVTRKQTRRSHAMQVFVELRNVKESAVIAYAARTLATSILPEHYKEHLEMVKAILPETGVEFFYPTPKALVNAKKAMRKVRSSIKRRSRPPASAGLFRKMIGLAVLACFIFAVYRYRDDLGLGNLPRIVGSIQMVRNWFGGTVHNVTKEEVDAAISDLAVRYAELTKRQQTTNKTDADAVKALKKDIESYNARNREVSALKAHYQAQLKTTERYKKEIVGDWRSTEELSDGVVHSTISTYAANGSASFDVSEQRSGKNNSTAGTRSALVNGTWEINGDQLIVRRGPSSNTDIAEGGGTVVLTIISLKDGRLLLNGQDGKRILKSRVR